MKRKKIYYIMIIFFFNYQLTLENAASDRGAESRLGAFILYNTARLSTLLQKFDQAVEEGKR